MKPTSFNYLKKSMYLILKTIKNNQKKQLKLITMKNLLLALFTFLSINAFSQSFDGVAISGDLPTAVAKYKAKGYKVSESFESGVSLKGLVANREVELMLFVTPKSKTLFKAVVFMPKLENWYDLKDDYNRYLEILSDNYGKPKDSYTMFNSPYKEGDGYEMTAVVNDKCAYAAYWFDLDNSNISLQISKYKQVRIAYENIKNMTLRDKEKSDIEKNVF